MTHGGPEWFKCTALKEHLITPPENSRQDLHYHALQDNIKAWWGCRAWIYPFVVCVCPQVAWYGFLSSFSAHSSQTIAQQASFCRGTLPPEAHQFKRNYFFESSLKRIIPHCKEGSAGLLLGLAHPWRLWSCDRISICLPGGLSAELIVCASLSSSLMFISLQYLQRDFGNKSLCKWEHAYKIQRNIKIH